MISVVSFGTNDKEKAKAFYEAIFSEVFGDGYQTQETERSVGWNTGDVSFGVSIPFDGEPATVGNGSMVCINVESNANVEQAYDKAISLGGSCEGEPGYRENGAYCAYFRDLDGNKLLAFAREKN